MDSASERRGTYLDHPHDPKMIPGDLPKLSTHCADVDDSRDDLEESVIQEDLPGHIGMSRPYWADWMCCT